MKTLIRVAATIALATFATTAHPIDMANVVKAQVVLGQVTKVVDKYREIQALFDSGQLEMDVPEPIDGSSGKFLFPFNRDGYLTAWGEKALTAQMGAQAGSMAADQAGKALASKVPFGGLLAGAAKKKAKSTGAAMAIGGWDFIKESTDTSFNSLADMSVYMHAHFNGDPDYEKALAAAMALYPKLERNHQRAIDKAYRAAKKKARKMNL